MRERHHTGRAIYTALPDELPAMFRKIAHDLNTTENILRNLKVEIDAKGNGHALIKWVWWAYQPSMPPYPAYHRSKDTGEHFSVPYLGQLGSAFTAAADWIEEFGIKSCSIHQDNLSGWWVLTIA